MWYVHYMRALEIAAARDAEAAMAQLARDAASFARASSSSANRSGPRRRAWFRRWAGGTFARLGERAERIALALDPDALCGDHRDAVRRIERGHVARSA